MVVVGLTDGLATVEVKPEGELVQLYVWPLVEDAPIVILPPKQILVLLPVIALGKGFTVITTVFVVGHPVSEIVSVKEYVVVVVGLTEGFDDVEVKPEGVEVQA